jgi:hypothetical protein
VRCIDSSASTPVGPRCCLDINQVISLWTCRAEVRNKIWTAAIVVIVATAALWLYKEGYTASLKVWYRSAEDACLLRCRHVQAYQLNKPVCRAGVYCQVTARQIWLPSSFLSDIRVRDR